MYAIFKINMYLFMKFPPADRDFMDFAKKLTTEYDNLIKRGGEILSKVPVAKGNTELMEMLVYLALLRQSFSQEEVFLDGIGEAIQGYWVGTVLQNAPIPPIPAPGSFQNQSLNSSFVTNIGEWTPDKLIPASSPLPFINKLIQKIKLHLLTVQGQHLTTSLYPGFPQTPPAPGVLPWVGYTIPSVPFIFPFFKRDDDDEDETTTTALDGEEKVDGQTLKERLDKKVKEIEEAEEQLAQEIQTFVEARPTPKTVKTAEQLRREIMEKMNELRCCDC